MKRIDFYYFLTILLIAGALVIPTFLKPVHVHRKPTPPGLVTRLQRESHMVVLVDEKERPLGLCSSTALGPHAILTATHCLEEFPASAVKIDLAWETHIILKVVTDGRDHMILLLSGTAFQVYEPVRVGTVEIGETLVFYGNGDAEYPPVPKIGKATDCEDPSDMDLQAAIFCFDTSVAFGDSGSALYNNKGEIVGLLTYVLNEGEATTGIGFGLAFRQDQYDLAYSFVPKE